MQIVLTGGGTGGHVFPNIAVIDELQKSRGSKNIEISYIGENNSLEQRVCASRGINFCGISAGKLRRYFDFANFVDAFKLPVGVMQAYLALKKIKPNLVFSKGGYVSVPVVLAARMLKIPVWTHESDLSPGLSNKICSRFACKIWLSFEESKKFFAGKNVEVVGNPIRSFLLDGSREKGFKLTGFNKDKPVILIIGGSIGAQSLNKIVFEVLPELLKKAQVIHITGSLESHTQAAKYAHELETKKSYKHFDFLEGDLAHVYAMTDLIVSRAGSGSIFESLACEKPMLLIPLPSYASRGDQKENAAIFEQKGFAVTLEQENLSPEIFLQTILNLLKNEELRAGMVKNQKNAKYKDAAKKIAKAMVEFC